MAERHSSAGSFTSQRMPAGQSLQRKNEALSPKKSWDYEWTEIVKENEILLGARIKQPKRSESTNSDNSSNRTQSSTVTSKTGYRTSLEVLPITPYSKVRAMHLDPPLGGRFPTIFGNETPNEVKDISGVNETNKVQPESQRPPSPRSEISKFRAEHTHHPVTVFSGPLERFLAQVDDPEDVRSDPVRLEEEWGRLRAARAKVLRLRARLRNKRIELHERELSKSSADETFIKSIREHHSASVLHPSTASPFPPEPVLNAHLASIQEARDNYGPLLDDYNKLEELLDQQEFEMAKIEGRLYNTTIQETPKSESILVGLSTEFPEEVHPLHMRYLSRLGDLDLARERHQNMIQERDSVLYQQESKLRVGLEVHEHERDFLSRFPEQEAALLREIADIEQDVGKQREICLAEGIDINASSLGDVEDSEDEGSSSEAPSKEANIDPSTFSLLLPKSVDDKKNLDVLITDFDEASKSDRINRWIRYQLQTSPLEVELFVRTFIHVLRIVDLRQWRRSPFQWQICVLTHWELDEANRSAEDYFKQSRTRNTITESNISAQNSAFNLFHRAATISTKTSKPSHKTSSAPGSIDLSKIFGKEELLRAKATLAIF